VAVFVRNKWMINYSESLNKNVSGALFINIMYQFQSKVSLQQTPAKVFVGMQYILVNTCLKQT
jgi:hypothetical protein